MPLDLSRTLVVGISSTALFDLEEAVKEKDSDEAIERYRGYMQEREDEPLEPGAKRTIRASGGRNWDI